MGSETDEQNKRPMDRLANLALVVWFQRRARRFIPAILGLTAGLAGGWWAGSFLSCARSVAGCEVRADSIEAAGTWVGGLGTVAAVLMAVVAFQADQRDRARERKETADEVLREARETAALARRLEKSLFEEAKRVRITCFVNMTAGSTIEGYQTEVENGADKTPIYRLQGIDFAGSLLPAPHVLPAGRKWQTQRRKSDLGEAPSDLPDDLELKKRAFRKWCEEGTSIMYMMNGRHWRRTGHGDPELIEAWDAEGYDAPR